MTELEFTLDPRQAAACAVMSAGHNVFLTGNAGTGKSRTLGAWLAGELSPLVPHQNEWTIARARLAELKEQCIRGSSPWRGFYAAQRELGESPFARIGITSTTGIAAINLRDQINSAPGAHGGMVNVSTLNRWAGLGLGRNPGESCEDAYSRNYKNRPPSQHLIDRVAAARTLVIDEVSMLSGATMDYLDFMLRRLRGFRAQPFGGLQIITCGDFLQLPPVEKGGGGIDWAFNSAAWRAAAFIPIMLRTVHRQGDPEYVELLNALRTGRLLPRHHDTLRTRVANRPSSKIIRLFTHNTQVDTWNRGEMADIEEPEVTFTGTEIDYSASGSIKPEALWGSILAPQSLTLKVGARVMLTANLQDTDGHLTNVNGELGTVLDLDQSGVQVLFDGDGGIATIERHTWWHEYGEAKSTRVTQIPLRPAWAITIHKAQGLSLDEALIDARAALNPGQTYVAISRVRTLERMHLRERFRGVMVSDRAIRFMQQVDEQSD